MAPIMEATTDPVTIKDTDIINQDTASNAITEKIKKLKIIKKIIATQ